MNIKENLLEIREKIRQAEISYGRLPGSVRMLAVTKGHSVSVVQEAYDAGQRDFGENYVQEALAKMQLVKINNNDVVWHYIGRIQTNKAKLLAQHFHWVQSITDVRHAKLLSAHRAQTLAPLNVCLEVNLSHELSKAGVGVDFARILELAKEVAILPQLKLRGLMSIPAPQHTFDEQVAVFSKLKEIYENLNANGLNLDTLSMGMSEDFVAAIAAGATIVRIGTAIFGERSKIKL